MAPPRRVWRIPPHKLLMVMSPEPGKAGFTTHHKRFVVAPLRGHEVSSGGKELHLSTGRDPDQVSLAIPWHPNQGPTQSKVHGTYRFRLSGEGFPEAAIHSIEYTDSSREGTAVYELPDEARSVRHAHELLKDALPHEQASHLMAGDQTGRSQVVIRPNRTVLVFGVPRGTVEHKNLTIREYVDKKGNRRFGFFDEFGNPYPWVMFFANPKHKTKAD